MPPPILMVPLSRVSLLEHPLPAPVLGFGPPALLDMVPISGCDDLLAEPWSAAELRFRLERLLERSMTVAGTHTFTWSPTQMALDGRAVPVSLPEHRLLDVLARAEGDWVPREALAAAAGVGLSGRALDMQVSRLRRKLVDLTNDFAEPPQLVAQRGFGYALRW